MSQLPQDDLDISKYIENYFDELQAKGRAPSEFLEPVDSRLLEGFKDWVAWLPFGRLCPGDGGQHPGYDYAAYLTNHGVCRFGLPDNMPVRAIADGNVMFVLEKGYSGSIYINHAINKNGAKRNEEMLMGNYGHVISSVEEGDFVKRGQVIGHLFNDDNSELFPRLSHLHFGIEIESEGKFFQLNPLRLFPYLENHGVDNCGHPYFKSLKSNTNVLPSKRRILANTIQATYLKYKDYSDPSECYARTHLGEWGKLF